MLIIEPWISRPFCGLSRTTGAWAGSATTPADVKAGKLNGLFDFDDAQRAPKLILDPSTGVVLRQLPC